MVVLWPNERRTPPRAVGRGSTAPTPREVGGTSFDRPWPLRTILVTSGPHIFPPRGVSADRPRNMRAAQCGLGVVVLWANTGRAPPTPPAGARPHQYRHRPAARPAKGYVVTAFKSRGARPARFSSRGVSADRPQSTRVAQCGLAWSCCGPTRGALLPTPYAGARLHQHRDRPVAQLLNSRGHCI